MKESLDKALEEIGKNTRDLETKLDELARPVRKSALRRFPIFFTLVTTFGAAAVFVGFERMLESIPIMRDNPLLILLCGISVLVLTGTLYKKL